MPYKPYRKFASIVIASMMGAIVILAGCTGAGGNTAQKESSAPSAGTTSSKKDKVDGGEIIVSNTTEHQGWMKLWTTSQVSTEIQELVFNGLYKLTDLQDIEPDLADGMPQVSSDSKELTVKIRKGITFSDGHPLTADDVVFSYNIPISKDYVGLRKSVFEQLQKIEKVDDTTVKFTFKEPFAGYYGMLAYAVVPQHVLKDVPIKEIEKSPFYKQSPVGSGPYKLVEWKDGQYLTFVRNETYFKGKPSIEKVTIKVIPSSNVAMAQLQTGEINVNLVTGENIAAIKEFAQKSGKIKLKESIPTTSYTAIAWNNNHPIFKDKLVRQAITTAIDRQGIISNVIEGQGVIVNSQTPPPFWNYTDKVPKFDYNEAKAKQMLADAGWKPGSDGVLVKDGKPLAFELLVSQASVERQKIATVIQQNLKKVGITVTPRVMENTAYSQNVRSSKYEATVYGWNRNGDPNPKGTWHTSSNCAGCNNHANYSNPEVDKLIDEDLRLLDINKRKETLAKIDSLIAEDQGYSFLYSPTDTMAYPVKLEGMNPKKSNLKDIENWYFTK
ncbi:peptide-binding protein [Paenibacillus sp. GP183]|jgi:peptide/nickel transport system substrate-binding protein|uniref:peptide-binding protein n=1 Tax=Paenibacillus sp. GP183 TaxID=1882751 RepID=UPI000899B3D7|nr:peptide-binding protein [Paenibacillus sp. GP183]SEB84988.1 peptide/nickel transport system substrate-binding protein [Paenibacillus sp. GP183]